MARCGHVRAVRPVDVGDVFSSDSKLAASLREVVVDGERFIKSLIRDGIDEGVTLSMWTNAGRRRIEPAVENWSSSLIGIFEAEIIKRYVLC